MTLLLAGVALLGAVLTACTSSKKHTAAPSPVGPSTSTTVSTSATNTPTLFPTTPRTSAAHRTTSAAPPTTGNISQTASAGQITTAPPVAITKPAKINPAVTVSLVKIESITAKSTGMPGEITGPALRVTVRIANGSATPLSLDDVFVTLHNASSEDGSPMDGNGGSAFSGKLAPGHTANGVYVFSIPTAHRNPITVTVLYSAAAKAVVFTGNAQ